ncbi:tetratricopeptide repeat protein [Pelagibaculum spongiae]|nr:tetratricopeptide repeat protein [Pelagibaculum spongiae]
MKLFPTTGLMLLLLSGCANLNTPETLAQASQPDTSQVKTATTPTEVALSGRSKTANKASLTSAKQLEQLLSAELLLSRGELAAALDVYLPTLAQQKDPEIVERIVELANQLKQYQIAADATKIWLELRPENPAAWVRSALFALQNNDAKTLEQSLGWLVANQPKDKFVILITQIANGNKTAQLLQALQQVTISSQQLPTIQLSQAYLFQSLNQLLIAQQLTDNVLENQPDWINAIKLKVRLLIQAQKTPQAMTFLQQQIEQHPRNFELRLQSAGLYIQQENTAKAAQAFKAILQIDPTNPIALISLSRLKFQGEQIDQAIELLKRIPRTSSEYDQAILMLGSIYEDQGNSEQAISYYLKVEGAQRQIAARMQAVILLRDQKKFKRALQVSQTIRPRSNQQYSRLLLLQSDIYEQQGKRPSALQILDHGLTLRADDIDLLYARAMLVIKQDDLESFETGMRKIIKLRPDYAFALNALGYTLVDKTTRWDEAQELIERALKLAPDEPAILDSMGWLLFKQGNPHAALEFLQKAWDGDQDPEIAAHLGEVLWLLSRQEEAAIIWKKGIETAPEHQILRQTLERYNQ